MRKNFWWGAAVILSLAMLVGGCAGKRPFWKKKADEGRLGTGLVEISEEAIPAELSARGKEFVESESIGDVYFDYDRYNIRADARKELAKNARWLKRYGGVEIQIEGHCDERGSNEYNMALGQRRAASARNYLISLGVNPEQIYTISYGEEKPFAMGHNEEAWAQNRRGHFLIRRRNPR